MAAKVVPLRMSRPTALQRIRALALDSGNIVPGPEVGKRMRQRQINWEEIVKVVQLGHIIEGPALDIKGGWRCTMERFAAGEDVKVVVSICGNALVVITTF